MSALGQKRTWIVGEQESVDAIHIPHGLIGNNTANIVFSRESEWRRQIPSAEALVEYG
jgi:hypothetical protein